MDSSLCGKLRFMLITDRHVVRRPLVEVVDAALSAGFTAVQLRERDLGAAELYDLARPLREITNKHEALLIINDRVDVALAAQADGVHLGWRSLDPLTVRNVVDSNEPFLIGASTHNIVEVRRALHARVDYISYGPVFPTPSKDELVDVVGIERLKRVAIPSPVPVVAVGGIDAGNIDSVFRTRVSGIALIRAVMGAADPYAAAKLLVEATPTPLPVPADRVSSR